jgi:hypothetical protein
MMTFNMAMIGIGVIAFVACLYNMLRCRHDWEPIVERELPSKAEELKKAGDDLSQWTVLDKLLKAATKTVVAIISCKKCGAVKIFKVTT